MARDAILLLGNADPKLPDWCALLRELGHEVHLSPPHSSHLADVARGNYDLVLFDVEGASEQAAEFCRGIKAAMGHNFIPLILITAPGDVASKVRGLELGADGVLVKPVYPDELSARVVSLLRIKHLHDELLTKNAELERVHGALSNAYETIQADLQLAQRLQRSLLPKQMPELAGISFAARYLASGTVGGDFYDAFRLDERHLGFYVADAVGHGVRAALLTVFLKKGIITKEISARSYRLLTPAEVLERLNEDMLREQLAESPFITIVYATLNVETLELQYSCAGHPFPIVLRREGTQELLDQGGGLVGVFEDRFDTGHCQLARGDRLICYTDGIQSAFGPTVADFVERFQDMLARLRHEELSRMLSDCEKELRRQAGHSELDDDLTLFGLDIRPTK